MSWSRVELRYRTASINKQLFFSSLPWQPPSSMAQSHDEQQGRKRVLVPRQQLQPTRSLKVLLCLFLRLLCLCNLAFSPRLSFDAIYATLEYFCNGTPHKPFRLFVHDRLKNCKQCHVVRECFTDFELFLLLAKAHSEII
jgi:hypothetical protein